MEEDDPFFGDGVSHISLDDDDSVVSAMSGFKSEHYMKKHPAKARGLDKRRGSGCKRVYGSESVKLEFIADYWTDKKPNGRCSLQIRMPSGGRVHNLTIARVSTDQKELIIAYPMSEFASNPLYAFNSYLIDPNNPCKMTETVLEYHPKTISRKKSIAKLTGRDSSKTKMLEDRIPLPFVCRHLFATNDEDPIFYGKKFVCYDDTSVWLHIELVADIGDSYQADKEDPNVVIGNKPPVHQQTGIPAQVHTPPRPTAPTGTPPTASTPSVPIFADPNAPKPAAATGAAAMEEDQPVAPHQAQVLKDTYEGAAYRSKSVKSCKRTAANQDGEPLVETVDENDDDGL